MIIQAVMIILTGFVHNAGVIHVVVMFVQTVTVTRVSAIPILIPILSTILAPDVTVIHVYATNIVVVAVNVAVANVKLNLNQNGNTVQNVARK